ncbi:MAG: IclR family transcriptional regulator [Micromonosporaceae bacterium]
MTPPDDAARPGSGAKASAIAKAVVVLEALVEQRRLSAIARSTGLPTSTVHRVLQELATLGWVREGEERDYMLGPGLLRLAGRGADDSDAARAARPALRALCDRTGYTVHFGIRHGDEAVYVDKLEGRGAYGMRSRIGAGMALHCTAIGKAVLAALPDDEVRLIAKRTGLPGRTAKTLTTADDLLTDLEAVRARGWAADDEENYPKIRCIGVVVSDHRGLPVGAVSLSGLIFDMEREHITRLAPLVVRAAQQVSAALGA